MTAKQQLLQKYGEPNAAYQSAHCMIWDVRQDLPWFPAKRFLINKDFKDKLLIAFKELEAQNLHHEIETFDGCYNDRSVRGKTSKSLHAWAAAIDLNAEKEKLGQATAATHWSPEFIAVMKGAGLFWGGDFKKRSDTMHFGLYNG